MTFNINNANNYFYLISKIFNFVFFWIFLHIFIHIYIYMLFWHPFGGIAKLAVFKDGHLVVHVYNEENMFLVGRRKISSRIAATTPKKTMHRFENASIHCYFGKERLQRKRRWNKCKWFYHLLFHWYY